MNRFKIVKGKEEEFEKVWKERDTHLEGVKGLLLLLNEYLSPSKPSQILLPYLLQF